MPKILRWSPLIAVLGLACTHVAGNDKTQAGARSEATNSPTTAVEGATPSVAPSPPSAASLSISPEIQAIVAAADRSPEDRELDAGRKPAELLAFLELQPGMKVAELMAGFGYTSELLARAVGPQGTVYGQNNAFVLQRFAEAGWAARLGQPAMKPVVRVDRELDDPLPPEAKDLDRVVMVLFYHDTFWLNVDRQRMNAAIFRALKPQGRYVIIDHSGRPQSGSTEVQTLHRIEEKVVREEIERAGFRLVQSAEFLRNPGDTRDWDASPRAAAAQHRRGQSDRFVLTFEKPL